MKQYLQFVLVVCCLPVFVLAQAYEWAKNAGGTGSEYGNSISVDASGNSYVTGYFTNPTFTFGSTTLTNAGSGGSSDLFVVKYDANGNELWAKSAGGTGSQYGNSISVDASGNSYVTGYFTSPTITFGLTTLTNARGYDIFISKIASPILNITSPTGSETWQTNSQHNITWNTNCDGNIKIEMTTDNGANWLTLQTSIAPNPRNYTLTVPPLASTQFRH